MLILLTLFYIIAHYTNGLIEEEIISGSNEFGFDLTFKIYDSESNNNIWISPYCITSCFALIYPGTGTNSNTRTQIGNALGYPSDETASNITSTFFTTQSSIESSYHGSYKLSEWYDSNNNITHSEIERIASMIGIANKIYSSYDINLKQTYIDILNNEQESFIEYNFNFSSENANKIINNWVYENTNELIDSIIGENQDISQYKLLALNAIYLNATFSSPFSETMTSLSKFYSDELRSTEVSDIHLMHQIDDFEYYSNGDYQFLKFKFDDWENDLFILFVLPITSNNDLDLIDDYTLIQTAINNLTSTRIALAIPKISIEIKYELNEYLQQLGITDAFDPILADFSEMTENAELMIDTVIHKTMISMDEKGLVAAAVTSISMVLTSIVIDEPILFRADHPFQLFIIDGTHDNNILFMGHINNPGIPDGSNTPQYDESVNEIWHDYDSYNDNIKIDSTEIPSIKILIPSTETPTTEIPATMNPTLKENSVTPYKLWLIYAICVIFNLL